VRRRARRLAWVYLIVAVGLIVWTVFRALSLPKENLEHHYRLTWVGFDLIEVLAIYLTARMAFRLDARVVFPATVVATLLVADAGERPRPRPPVRRDPVVVRPLGNALRSVHHCAAGLSDRGSPQASPPARDVDCQVHDEHGRGEQVPPVER
jgi:hypothetical protein